MNEKKIKNSLIIPEASTLTKDDYFNFLKSSYELFRYHPQYLSGSEGMEVLELAHLIPAVAETVLSIYIGINDAVCNKGLVTPFLPRHAHNNVFVFDPQVYPGKKDVPAGTVDAREIINGFRPPNDSWDPEWTYVMIEDPARSYESLWSDPGYIDMIPAKFEDFTMLSDTTRSRVCIFIDPEAFEHPVNKGRVYLKQARQRGEKLVSEFEIPEALEGETANLVPVVPEHGEKLYVARADFKPCDHCWSNIHSDNDELAIVNENSAVPLNLVITKPPVSSQYRTKLIPPAGSSDNTTDRFFRGMELFRTPIRQGHIGG
jgi:hypothetical protein